jgi:hypothetical protein
MTVHRIHLVVVLAALTLMPRDAHAQHDLSGVWMRQQPGNSFSDAPPPAFTPWALERFKSNRPTVGPDAALDANDPTVDCVPPGVPYVLTIPTPFELVHAKGELIQLFEYNHFIRRIHMDGRGHPADLRDTGAYEWMGHSIGRWEGDALVIDTVGFNDTTWLDRLGRPHSDALHLIERIHRTDRDTLVYEITVNDPKAYVAPWTGRIVFTLRPDWEILEHVCTTTAETYDEFKAKAWQTVK